MMFTLHHLHPQGFLNLYFQWKLFPFNFSVLWFSIFSPDAAKAWTVNKTLSHHAISDARRRKAALVIFPQVIWIEIKTHSIEHACLSFSFYIQLISDTRRGLTERFFFPLQSFLVWSKKPNLFYLQREHRKICRIIHEDVCFHLHLHHSLAFIAWKPFLLNQEWANMCQNVLEKGKLRRRKEKERRFPAEHFISIIILEMKVSFLPFNISKKNSIGNVRKNCT